MKKLFKGACAAGIMMGLMAVPFTAFADDEISVTVQAYDYTAVSAGVEGASTDGVILDYTFSVPAGTTDKEAITKAFSDKGISITGVADAYVTEVNGLSGAYPGGWCIGYNNDDYSNWGIGYMGAAGDGVLADGDVIRLDYTVNGGADIGMDYYGLPIIESLTLDGVTYAYSKETVYNADTYAGETTYYAGALTEENKIKMMGKGTEAEPFVIYVTNVGKNTSASCTICLNEKYGSTTLADTLDFSDDVNFSVSTNGKKTAYYVLVAEGANTGDSSNIILFAVIAVLALAAIVVLLLTSKKKNK